MDFVYDGKGLFKGEKIINLLKDVIGDYEITRLPIAFTAVAMDLKTQKEVWFSGGFGEGTILDLELIQRFAVTLATGLFIGMGARLG